MLVGVIIKPTMQALEKALLAVDTSIYDALELRLDACQDLDVERLAQLQLPLPCIFTLRCKEEGGYYTKSEAERILVLQQLIQLRPAWLDIEASVGEIAITSIRQKGPDTRILLSAHNFTATPDLEDLLDSMRKQVHNDLHNVTYKIACYAQNTLDTLRMLALCKKYGQKVLGISMGEDGISTRILAPVFHCGICYCPIDVPSAPGQLDAKTLLEVYNATSLNAATRIYGLLGDPVEQSMGHLFHNNLNKINGINAVYVKWRISKEDLPKALPLLHYIGVEGLSVTMPLKESLLPLLDGVDENTHTIKAANTIVRTSKGYTGYNTDSSGIISAMNRPLKNTTIAIIGAGGAAKAAIAAAYLHTSKLLVFNRTTEKPIPAPVPVHSFSNLHLLRQGYDIIINALPFTSNFDFTQIPFHQGAFAMDLSYGKVSHFLQRAEQAGCQTADGTAMFHQQALGQRKIWGM